ncbi:2934_t:CDS:2 [Dentiscutata erythropus]|uniref:2934_t:CDS:1 n=1 Tax=Dentiscutata erythropus TaxID=1348616 RepID=A0A9N8Z6A2_9GLOM|nr:2934_t:CDS:2 [Dentiscutata erythropus]
MIAYSHFVEPSQGRYDESFRPQSLNNSLNNSMFPCATSPLNNDFENESNFNKSLTGSECENELSINKKELTEAKRVKNLLSLFPPPCSAEEFFNKNPPKVEENDGKVKRPCNKFIIFRKVAHDQKKGTTKLMNYNERTFSKYIGIIWKHLITSEEKDHYEKLAAKVAEIHKNENPNYKYKPKRDKATWKQYSPTNQRKKKTQAQTTYSQTDDFNKNLQTIQSQQQVYYLEEPTEFNEYFASNNISDNIQDDNNSMQYYEYNENYMAYFE